MTVKKFVLHSGGNDSGSLFNGGWTERVKELSKVPELSMTLLTTASIIPWFYHCHPQFCLCPEEYIKILFEFFNFLYLVYLTLLIPGAFNMFPITGILRKKLIATGKNPLNNRKKP